MVSKKGPINLEAEQGGVIAASGSSLTAVKGGRGRFRVKEGNYTGPWYGCSVFYDFSGDWHCDSDGQGSSIEMNVPSIQPLAFRAGAYFDIYGYYGSGRSVANLYQLDKGFASFMDAVTFAHKYDADVEIGPAIMQNLSWMPTQIFGNNFKELGLIAFNGTPGYGFLTYATDSSIQVQTNNGHSYTLVRGKGHNAPVAQGSFNLGGTDYKNLTVSCYPSNSNYVFRLKDQVTNNAELIVEIAGNTLPTAAATYTLVAGTISQQPVLQQGEAAIRVTSTGSINDYYVSMASSGTISFSMSGGAPKITIGGIQVKQVTGSNTSILTSTIICK